MISLIAKYDPFEYALFALYYSLFFSLALYEKCFGFYPSFWSITIAIDNIALSFKIAFKIEMTMGTVGLGDGPWGQNPQKLKNFMLVYILSRRGSGSFTFRSHRVL